MTEHSHVGTRKHTHPCSHGVGMLSPGGPAPLGSQGPISPPWPLPQALQPCSLWLGCDPSDAGLCGQTEGSLFGNRSMNPEDPTGLGFSSKKWSFLHPDLVFFFFFKDMDSVPCRPISLLHAGCCHWRRDSGQTKSCPLGAESCQWGRRNPEGLNAAPQLGWVPCLRSERGGVSDGAVGMRVGLAALGPLTLEWRSAGSQTGDCLGTFTGWMPRVGHSQHRGVGASFRCSVTGEPRGATRE